MGGNHLTNGNCGAEAALITRRKPKTYYGLLYDFKQRFQHPSTNAMMVWLAPKLHRLRSAVRREYEERYERERRELLTRLALEFDEVEGETDEALILRMRGYLEDLRVKACRDPNTNLFNSAFFKERLESFLAMEQREPWCAVGFVDIRGFKWYNDALGHLVGDKIIVRVAHLLRDQVRAEDLLTRQTQGEECLHCRFGGDEFCFLIPDLFQSHQAEAIGNRYREAVAGFDWSLEDPRLNQRSPRVDIGVVCLWLGSAEARRNISKRLATDLIQLADKLMYEAKSSQCDQVKLLCMQIVGNELVAIRDNDIL